MEVRNMAPGDELPVDYYNSFPPSDQGIDPANGYNRIVKLNDPDLFTLNAQHPNYGVIKAFFEAPFKVYFVQLSSSTREAEWYLHVPGRALVGNAPGIEIGEGVVFNRESPIGTHVINHDATLARTVMHALIVDDGNQAGQIIHKQPPPPEP